MDDKDSKYLQFPLIFMRDLFTDRTQTITNIIRFGICRFAEMVVGNLEIDVEELDATEKIVKAAKYLGIRLGITPTELYSWYQEIVIALPDKEPLPMVKVDLLFKFRNENCSQNDLEQFAAHIGIRSIIGTHSYCQTNKKMILARMLGHKDHKQLFESNIPDAIKPIIEKYSKRYWMEKLIQEMEMTWNFVVYSGMGIRGYYVGTRNKISRDSLIIAAEKKRRKNRAAELKEQKAEAREKALRHLNKESNSQQHSQQNYYNTSTAP